MSAKIIHVKIITPQETVFEGETYQATIPTKAGEITILPNHIPYISALKMGKILLKHAHGRIAIAVSVGFIEFSNNQLTILADTAKQLDDIVKN